MKKIALTYALLMVTNHVTAMQKDIAESLMAKYINQDGTVTAPIQHLLKLTNTETDQTIANVADQTQKKWFNLQWDHSKENGFDLETLDQIINIKKELNISSVGKENPVNHLVGYNGVPPSILKLLLAIESEQKSNDLQKVTIFSIVNPSSTKALQQYSQKDFSDIAKLFGKILPDSFILPVNQTEATECLRNHLFPNLKNITFEYIEYADNSNDDVVKNWAANNKSTKIKVVSSSGQLTSHLLKFHLCLLPNAIEIVGGQSIQEDEFPEIEKLYHDTGDNLEKKANFVLNDISRTLVRINKLKQQ